MQGVYKEELLQHFGIVFNNLFCLNNMPIKRYVDYLQRRNKLEEYMKVSSFLFQPYCQCKFAATSFQMGPVSIQANRLSALLGRLAASAHSHTFVKLWPCSAALWLIIAAFGTLAGNSYNLASVQVLDILN